MRILAGLVITGTLVGMGAFAATAAAAQPGHLSDVAYMQAARCAGLASSSKLGSADAAALASLVRSQAWGRDPYVLDKADDMQSQAKREADRADEYSKARLSAELNGACAALKS